MTKARYLEAGAVALRTASRFCFFLWLCTAGSEPSFASAQDTCSSSFQRLFLHEEKAEALTRRFKDLLPPGSDARLRHAEFERMYQGLHEIAAEHGIRIFEKTETIGVFPYGIDAIGISGLGHLKPSEAPSAVARHELAHLFHTIELRVALIESLGKSTASQLSPPERQAAEKKLRLWEERLFNYVEFERMANRASSLLHHFSGDDVNSSRRYVDNLKMLIQGTALIVDSGVVRFPQGNDLASTYAYFISRAPYIVGRSGAELAGRMSGVAFVVAYSSNTPLGDWMPDAALPSGMKKSKLRRRQIGFRDWINQWILSTVPGASQSR